MSENDRSLSQAVKDACRTVVRSAKDEDGSGMVEAVYVFAPGFPGFEGHFPGKPVLPAIVQLAAVRCTVEQALNTSLGVRSYNKVKFKGMLTPGDEVVVGVRFREEDEGIDAEFTLKRSDGEPVGQGDCRLRYRSDRIFD